MSAPSFGENRPGCLRYIILGAIVVGLGFLFWNEIRTLWQLVRALPNLMQGKQVAGLAPAKQILGVLGFMGLNVIAGLSLGYLILYMLSGQVLPVQNNVEKGVALRRLHNFIFGQRAPVLIIKEGVWVNKPEEPVRVAHGLALVDLNSAVLLERQWGPVFVSPNIPQDGSQSRFPMTRVGPPGLVFIRRGEKLRGIVSLRKQFRINLGVLAYTSDGIELRSHVFAIFTLGQPASIIKVAYASGANPNGDNAADLRVVQIDPITKLIKSIDDELDEDDKAEIHAFAQQYLSRMEANVPLELVERSREYPPFHIDERRIFSAVFSQALDVNDRKLETWMDLPSLVATEIFRYKISQVTYDSLYTLEDVKKFPLQTDFKPKFARILRYMGVISYQFIHRLDDKPPLVGQKVEHRQFRISPVQELHNSKVLRDRGIKVIHAGFSELKPTNPMIAAQRLDTWRARWQQEIVITQADHDYEAAQIRNQARIEKQREMITKLSKILQSSPYSEEAMTLRILQSLDEVAADPATRHLLPKDTLSVLHNMQHWLSPEEKGPPANLIEENYNPRDTKDS